jgi:hypothetical protein
MSRPLLATALAYAADALPVFPLFEPTAHGVCSCGYAGCRSGHPRTRHGLHDASTDAATIETWWERWPTANIGLRTGTHGGIVAVDVDSVDAGLALVELEDGRSLGGLIVHTGRGYHIWYRNPADVVVRNSASRVAPGIDVRGDGGYVTAPPSLHRTRCRYRFAGGNLEPVPAWLLKLIAEPKVEQLSAPARKPTARQRLELERARCYGAAVLRGRCEAVRAAIVGGRNYALLRAATTVGGYIATGAIDEDEARAQLSAAGLDVGLDSKETARTIASGFRRGKAHPLQVAEPWGTAHDA